MAPVSSATVNPIRPRRPYEIDGWPGRDPDRVRDDHRIGRQRRAPGGGVARHGGGQAGREVGAADLFFQLPEELDVGAHAVLDRQPRAVERGQRRSLVVGRAAREPARRPGAAARVARQLERRRAPALAVGGLHVQVVVDGHRRKRRVLEEAADHHREAAGVDGVDLRARLAQQVGAQLRARGHLGAAARIHADARNPAQRGEPFLERRGQVRDPLLEPRAVDHPPICTIALRGPPSPMSWKVWPGRFPASAAADRPGDRVGAARVQRDRAGRRRRRTRGRRAARPTVDSRSRLQVVQKCSVIGEMIPKRRARRRRRRRSPARRK